MSRPIYIFCSVLNDTYCPNKLLFEVTIAISLIAISILKLNFDERPTARVLSAPDGENLKIQIKKTIVTEIQLCNMKFIQVPWYDQY